MVFVSWPPCVLSTQNLLGFNNFVVGPPLLTALPSQVSGAHGNIRGNIRKSIYVEPIYIAGDCLCVYIQRASLCICDLPGISTVIALAGLEGDIRVEPVSSIFLSIGLCSSSGERSDKYRKSAVRGQRGTILKKLTNAKRESGRP